jgi:phosphatidylinositol-3-phosphatase
LSTSTTHDESNATLPKPDHVVIVMEENQAYSQIIGSSNAPYINALASQGALFTNSYAITHPSQPNYVALFCGSTQGLTDDSCPHTFSGPDLGSQLLEANYSFAGYSEDLPGVGSTVCTSSNYARKHAPWTNFTDVPASSNQLFTSFPSDYTELPTVSFVIPNLLDDMHSASIQQGDTWLQNNLDSYAQWAKTHNSLLIVTWDEDDNTSNNHIATIFVGANIKTGQYSESITHYSVLRTIQAFYNLSPINNSANVPPITDIWS